MDVLALLYILIGIQVDLSPSVWLRAAGQVFLNVLSCIHDRRAMTILL